jgi:translation initiation factor 2B subunit (eIF-2B alpha/beta/delta family)
VVVVDWGLVVVSMGAATDGVVDVVAGADSVVNDGAVVVEVGSVGAADSSSAVHAPATSTSNTTVRKTRTLTNAISGPVSHHSPIADNA